MAMTKIPINEKNMAVLESISRDGFMYIDDLEQPQPTNIRKKLLFHAIETKTYGFKFRLDPVKQQTH